MERGVAGQLVEVRAVYANGTPYTGGAGTITISIAKDGGAIVGLSNTTVTEKNSTRAPGWYYGVIANATEANAAVLSVYGNSTTANVVVIAPGPIALTPANYSFGNISATGQFRGDITLVNGCATDAANLATAANRTLHALPNAAPGTAGGLIGNGTGAGQLSVHGGGASLDFGNAINAGATLNLTGTTVKAVTDPVTLANGPHGGTGATLTLGNESGPALAVVSTGGNAVLFDGSENGLRCRGDQSSVHLDSLWIEDNLTVNSGSIIADLDGDVLGGVVGDVAGKVLGGGASEFAGDGAQVSVDLGNTPVTVGNVTLAASQPNYAPAKAGDAMTLANGAITGPTFATSGNAAIGAIVAGNVAGNATIIGLNANTALLVGIANQTTTVKANVACMTQAVGNQVADHVRRRNQANVANSTFGDALNVHSHYGQIQQCQNANTAELAGFITIRNPDGSLLGNLTQVDDENANSIIAVGG